MISTIDEALNYIHGRPRVHKLPSIARMEGLMERLGHPELDYPVIHITGTNGKGSVTKMLTSMLMDTGFNVGMYTSPFIEVFNERIQYNGNLIPDGELIALLNRLIPIIEVYSASGEDRVITEFEVITAIMFMYFSELKVDVAVVEVGIGGRFDCTNVVHAALAVITTIGMDHQRLLGSTLKEIAWQKGGIIKKHIPVVVGRLQTEALLEIEEISEVQGSPLTELDVDFKVKQRATMQWGEHFDFQTKNYKFDNLHTALTGDYQVDNAAVAVEAYLKYMDLIHQPVNARAIKHGLKEVFWPARFEVLNEQPLIIGDGAHNINGMDALVHSLQHRYKQQDKYLIFSALKDKAIEEMVAIIKQLPNFHLLIVPSKGARGITKDELQERLSDDSLIIYDDFAQALKAAMSEMSAEDIIVFTGSLYFVSEVRNYFESE